MSFYDEWLSVGSECAAWFARSPGVSRDADHPWIETRQDARVKVMLSDELGFPTMGGVVLKAEIPPEHHTGAHVHGEEAIHVVSGTGHVIIAGHRFGVRPGSTIAVPYRAPHQLVNTGQTPMLYVSALIFPLERFVKLAALEQLQDHGPNTDEHLTGPLESSYELPSGRRVVIHLDEAPTYADQVPSEIPAAYRNQHGEVRYLMTESNRFPAMSSVAMSHVFEEPPRHHGGRHKHLEAVLYVLDGDGYTDVQGVRQPWTAGDVLHIPPAMYEHEHFNESDRPSRMLRIQFGIRYWFTDLWPEGYRPRRIYTESGDPLVRGPIEGG